MVDMMLNSVLAILFSMQSVTMKTITDPTYLAPEMELQQSQFSSHPGPLLRLIRLSFFTALFFLLFLFPVHVEAAVPLQVKVIGLENILEKNVLHYLNINKKKDEDELNVRWIKRLHEQAPQQVREALQPYGYYLPVIRSRLNEIKGNWMAEYTVDPGSPVIISKRDIQWQGPGADKPAFKQSIKEYHQNVGERLVHSEYEAAKSRFLDLALSQGYPKAKIIKSEVLVDMETNSAEITLYIDTGPMYAFGDTRFKQDFLDPDLLNHYATITPGESYSHESLRRFQQNLLSGNYAREVTIKPMFNEAKDRQVPLDVMMKPVAPHKFIFGLGYETDIGVRGSARWTDRLINRYGHHSEVYLKVSEKESLLKGEYSIPVVNPVTDRWVSTVSYEYEETATKESDKIELETAFVRRNLEDTHFYKGFILESTEKFSVGNKADESTTLLIFGGTARFSEIEDDMFPQKGHYIFVDLRGSAQPLISDTSFTRVNLRGRYLLGLGKNGRLDLRLETGAAWVDDFDLYPASLRFFAGGDDSIRGYEYQSLGPKDEDGIVEGGRQLLTGSIEVAYRVAQSWVLTGFIDAGNAYNDELDTTYVGAGIGFRWLAPFGSLRVDLAWPVSEQPEINDARIHIGFGATL